MNKPRRSKLWLLLLISLLILLAYSYWPRPVTQAQLHLYRDVFCLTLERTKSEDKQQLIQLMQQQIKNNASSYALKKQEFNQKAATIIVGEWQALSSKLQAQAKKGHEVCRQVLATAAPYEGK